MCSGGVSLSDIRVEVLLVEDKLFDAKAELHQIRNDYEGEKLKRKKELEELEVIVREREAEVKVKEEQLENVKQEYENVKAEIRTIEKEIEKKDEERKKVEKEFELEKGVHTTDIKLKKELKKLKEMREELLSSCEWLKEIDEDGEIDKYEEAENGPNEEYDKAWSEMEKKLYDYYDHTMRDLDNLGFDGERYKLQELKHCLSRLDAECKIIEKDNMELQQELCKLEKGLSA